MTVPLQASATPPTGDSSNPGGETPPAAAATPPASSAGFDPTALTQDQLNAILEKNTDIWKNPRLAELREAKSKLTTAEEEARKKNEEQLVEQKKFEELATQRGTENETLKSQIQTLTVNQALSALLVKENVVDLEGALKLVDRSKISVGDDGTVTGVDTALESLKSEKAYLFNTNGQPNVGNPGNPGNGATPPAGGVKFKRSQLTPSFIKEHEKEVMEAYKKGLIEDDGPAPAI